MKIPEVGELFEVFNGFNVILDNISPMTSVMLSKKSPLICISHHKTKYSKHGIRLQFLAAEGLFSYTVYTNEADTIEHLFLLMRRLS